MEGLFPVSIHVSINEAEDAHLRVDSFVLARVGEVVNAGMILRAA